MPWHTHTHARSKPPTIMLTTRGDGNVIAVSRGGARATWQGKALVSHVRVPSKFGCARISLFTAISKFVSHGFVEGWSREFCGHASW